MNNKYINKTISTLYRCNQRFFAQKLLEYSIPLEVGQIPSLIQVYRYPGITQDGISLNVGIDKGTVARTIKQLEEYGFVIRETDLKDRRINHIFPTDNGLKIKDKVFEIIRELHETLYEGLSEEQIEMAISLLQHMQENMDKYMGKDTEGKE